MKKLHLALLTGAALTLGACQTTSSTHTAKSDLRGLDSAIHKAAHVAEMQGATEESLLFYEELYKRNPADAQAIISYARALRRNGKIEKAEIILENNKAVSLEARAEYAKLMLGQGDLYMAEQEARAILKKSSNHAQGHHILGLALDAMGKHKEAEAHLRKALEHWDGNPVTVLNNLSLNLAQQGAKQEAIALIDKALAYAPNDERLHKNRALITMVRGHVPAPNNKPVIQ